MSAPVDVLAVLRALANYADKHGSPKRHAPMLREAGDAIAALMEAAHRVVMDANFTAPEDRYHEVGREDMAALAAALRAVGGAE